MIRLILASQSPARLETLRSAGIEPIVRISGVDEDAELARLVRDNHGEHPSAAAVALTLARAKAEAVAATATGALVLGCDSVLDLDGEIHGKPSDAAEAAERWRRMRGRSGILHSGHWLIDARTAAADDVGRAVGADQPVGGRAVGATASTVVHFADLTDDEITAYVATGEPLHVAGAFTIDGLGGPFISGIEGDHHAVVGLSLPLLRGLLGDLGLTVMDLWRVPSGARRGGDDTE